MTTAAQRRSVRRAYLASEMARLAGRAEPTPTTTEAQIAFGVRMADALRTPPTLEGGKEPQMPTLARIPDQQGSISLLEEWAYEVGDEPMRASVFVNRAFESPITRKRVATDTARANARVDGTIGYWEVLALAYEWDKEGKTTAAEFVEALSCEVSGHPRGDAVSSILADKSATSEISQVTSEPDEYRKWRYGE